VDVGARGLVAHAGQQARTMRVGQVHVQALDGAAPRQSSARQHFQVGFAAGGRRSRRRTAAARAWRAPAGASVQHR
jgi:hypothetical protein